MDTTRASTLFLSLVLALSSRGSAQQQSASFQPLGVPPGATGTIATAISPDGLLVVGNVSRPGGQQAFRWNGTLTVLPDLSGGPVHSEARGVSIQFTGGYVVGSSASAAGQVPCMWDMDGAVHVQPSLDPSHPAGAVVDVASVGLLGAGYSWLSGQDAAVDCIVDPSTPSATPLEYASVLSHARAISAFGNVIVGERLVGGVLRAYRWNAWELTSQLLDGPGSPYSASAASNTSTDGSMTVGHVYSAGAPRAVLWRDGQTIELTDPTGTVLPLMATGISGVGQRIVGLGIAGASSVAWVWDELNGVRRLQQVLEQEHGLTLPPGYSLVNAVDISGDGRKIAGTCIDPQGRVQAFLVHLPGPCRADVAPLHGVVNLADVGKFTDDRDHGRAAGDLNGDGLLNLPDCEIMGAALNGACD